MKPRDLFKIKVGDNYDYIVELALKQGYYITAPRSKPEYMVFNPNSKIVRNEYEDVKKCINGQRISFYPYTKVSIDEFITYGKTRKYKTREGRRISTCKCINEGAVRLRVYGTLRKAFEYLGIDYNRTTTNIVYNVVGKGLKNNGLNWNYVELQEG